MNFRRWPSLVQVAAIVSIVGVVVLGLAFLSEAQSSDLETSMGATGLLTLSMLMLMGAAVLWLIVLGQLCSHSCRRLFRRL